MAAHFGPLEHSTLPHLFHLFARLALGILPEIVTKLLHQPVVFVQLK